jgi:hypothetical protein
VAVAVTVYVPPGVPPLPLLELPDPQAFRPIIDNPNSNTINITPTPLADQRFPRLVGPSMSSPGTTSAKNKLCFCPSGQCGIAEEACVVAIVIVVLTALPFGVTLAGLNEQLAPVGSPLQLAPLNVMVWLNPPLGVIVTIVVPCWPGELIVTVVGLAPIVKSGAGFTVSVCVEEVEPTNPLPAPALSGSGCDPSHPQM